MELANLEKHTHTHTLIAFDQSFAQTEITLYACSQTLSQTKLLSTVLELAHHSYCSQLDRNRTPDAKKPEHRWTTNSKNTALKEEGKCGFVNYFSFFFLASERKSGPET